MVFPENSSLTNPHNVSINRSVKPVSAFGQGALPTIGDAEIAYARFPPLTRRRILTSSRYPAGNPRLATEPRSTWPQRTGYLFWLN